MWGWGALDLLCAGLQMWTGLPFPPLISWLSLHLCWLHSMAGSHCEVAEVATSSIRRGVIWATLTVNLFSPVAPTKVQGKLFLVQALLYVYSWIQERQLILQQALMGLVLEDGNAYLAGRSSKIHYNKMPWNSQCWWLSPGPSHQARSSFLTAVRHPGYWGNWPFDRRKPSSLLQSSSRTNIFLSRA